VNDWGEELGIEEEEASNVFWPSSFIDVDIDCIAFPSTQQLDMVT
jgi:hypothetical protein